MFRKLRHAIVEVADAIARGLSRLGPALTTISDQMAPTPRLRPVRVASRTDRARATARRHAQA